MAKKYTLYRADDAIEIDHTKRTLFVSCCRSGKTTRIAQDIARLKTTRKDYIYILTKYHKPPEQVLNGSLIVEIGDSVVYFDLSNITKQTIQTIRNMHSLDIKEIILLAIQNSTTIFIDESDLFKDAFEEVLKHDYKDCVVALQGLSDDFSYKFGRHLEPTDFDAIYVGRINSQEGLDPIDRKFVMQLRDINRHDASGTYPFIKIDAADWIPELSKEIAINPSFVEAMRQSLILNSHKGDWADWSPTKQGIINDLMHKVVMLSDAIERGDSESASREASNIGNYAEKAFSTFGHKVICSECENISLDTELKLRESLSNIEDDFEKEKSSNWTIEELQTLMKRKLENKDGDQLQLQKDIDAFIEKMVQHNPLTEAARMVIENKESFNPLKIFDGKKFNIESLGFDKLISVQSMEGFKKAFSTIQDSIVSTYDHIQQLSASKENEKENPLFKLELKDLLSNYFLLIKEFENLDDASKPYFENKINELLALIIIESNNKAISGEFVVGDVNLKGWNVIGSEFLLITDDGEFQIGDIKSLKYVLSNIDLDRTNIVGILSKEILEKI
ncbi:MAG: hypothetical protein JHC39_07415 [Lentimicrobium sp.]|nr:hypothetical protein [Lentimicrobium sp.]